MLSAAAAFAGCDTDGGGKGEDVIGVIHYSYRGGLGPEYWFDLTIEENGALSFDGNGAFGPAGAHTGSLDEFEAYQLRRFLSEIDFDGLESMWGCIDCGGIHLSIEVNGVEVSRGFDSMWGMSGVIWAFMVIVEKIIAETEWTPSAGDTPY